MPGHYVPGGLSTGRQFARNITRSANRIGGLRGRRGRYGPNDGPVGPKLVVGRGLKRRRADVTVPFRWVTYLSVAVAASYAAAKLLLGG